MYLIETMLQQDGSVALWPRHLARLQHACAALGWRLPGKAGHVPAGLPDGIVRLTVGEGGAVAWTARPLLPLPQPYGLALSPVRVRAADVWRYHKTSRRAPYEQAQAWARARGLADALLANEQGAVTESAIANLIVEKAGVWWTPPLGDGVLPGVMRGLLVERGRVEVRSLALGDVAGADAVYLCNAVRGVFRAEWVGGYSSSKAR